MSCKVLQLLTSCPLFMWTKFGLKLQKILRCRRPGGGGGGWSVISDTPGRGGRGGSKKVKFLRTSFMDDPLSTYKLRYDYANVMVPIFLSGARSARKKKGTITWPGTVHTAATRVNYSPI